MQSTVKEIAISLPHLTVKLLIQSDHLYQYLRKTFITLDHDRPHDTVISISIHQESKTRFVVEPPELAGILPKSIVEGESFEAVEFVIKGLIAPYCTLSHIIFLHASSLSINNQGYVFMGPSGVGKSTLVSNIAHPARVLSEDIAIIHKQANTYYVYSSPFDACKVVAPQQSVPLKALFLLQQARELSIQTLTAPQRITTILQNSFHSCFYEKNQSLHPYKNAPAIQLSTKQLVLKLVDLAAAVEINQLNVPLGCNIVKYIKSYPLYEHRD